MFISSVLDDQLLTCYKSCEVSSADSVSERCPNQIQIWELVKTGFFWKSFFSEQHFSPKNDLFIFLKQNKKSESFTQKHFQENFSQKKRENQIQNQILEILLNKNLFV